MNSNFTLMQKRTVQNPFTSQYELNVVKISCHLQGQSGVRTMSIRKYVYNLLESTPGLLAIVITDKDGVLIVKVCSKDNPELSQRSSYIAPFASASDQASKLGLGRNNTIVCLYDKFQVVSMNKGSVHMHFVGAADGNTGDFLTLDSQLDPILPNLEELVNVVRIQGDVL
ncbi:Ragulator complex protein LAMTOR3 [Trinorchestia longiramus]|nr:Ragulator complex protein LAMTOR3 [Trinorchestia longiramus]